MNTSILTPLPVFFPELLEDFSLESRILRVLGRLTRRAGRDRISFESIDSIARAIKISVKSIKDAYQELIACGFIERIGRGRYRVKDCGFYVSARLDEAGLTPTEFHVYCQLCRWLGRSQKPVSLVELETSCGLNIATIRRAIDVLVRRNMIRKFTQPGRSSVFGVTSDRDWDTPIMTGDTLIKCDINPDQKRPQPRSSGAHKGKLLEGKLLEVNPLYPPTAVDTVATRPTDRQEEGGIKSEEENLTSMSTPFVNHPAASGDPAKFSPLSPPYSAAPPLSPLVQADDFIDNPSQLDRIRAGEQRRREGRATPSAIKRASQQAFNARLTEHGITSPDFLHWCLPRFREWMQNVAGDETDLASVRNILLYWARPLEYAADEDQLQRHACLNRYIQSFVKERDEQEALRVYERQQAEALEQSRAELAAIEAAYPKPSINPYQAAAEAAQRRRQSQS